MNYVIIVITVLLSAFFSGTELSMTAVNKLRLQKLADEGDKRAGLALKISSNYDWMLSGVLIGNNLVNILCSSVATLIFLQFFDEGAAATISTVVMTVIILIFGEIVPKLVANNAPETFAKFVCIPLRVVLFIFTPFIYLSLAVVKLITKAVVRNGGEEQPTVTEEELVSIIERSEEEGVIDESSSEMMQSAIEFGETTLGEILTPRRDMIAIDIDDDPDEILEIAMNSSYSRIPVYRDSIDHIIGILYLNHYFKKASEVGYENVDIENLLVDVCFFHKAMKLPAALRQMRLRQLHLSIVTDEYGGTLGLVTLEDIVEEIVGEIWDESDEIKDTLVSITENTYEVSGDLSIFDFFEELEISTKDFESDYNTVGGWAIEMLDGDPHEADRFEYKNLTIVISEMSEMRVMKLTVIVNPVEEEEE
ncbi:MAG: HlyC/CorC family transporter [Clostridia bacterium]|nr:HlyC/CorC family transporter [Clostridia bacterium]